MARKMHNANDEVSAVGELGVTTTPLLSRPEYYVDAEEAAEFLCLHPRTMLQKARAGIVPGHPFGDGRRKRWRFLLSELDEYMRGRVNSTCGATRVITNERKVQ